MPILWPKTCRVPGCFARSVKCREDGGAWNDGEVQRRPGSIGPCGARAGADGCSWARDSVPSRRRAAVLPRLGAPTGPLTTPKQVSDFPASEAERAAPVRLTGVATFYHQASASLQSSNRAARLSWSTPGPHRLSLTPPRQIEVVGVTRLGKSSTIVRATEVRVLGEATQPRPVQGRSTSSHRAPTCTAASRRPASYARGCGNTMAASRSISRRAPGDVPGADEPLEPRRVLPRHTDRRQRDRPRRRLHDLQRERSPRAVAGVRRNNG